MDQEAGALSRALCAALEALSGLDSAQVHRLQVGLAELVLPQAPPGAAAQLELARAFIEGRAEPAALRDAQQDCWSYVGSLACGCSVSDSASAHAIMTCLETSPAAHEVSALREQVERVARCGVADVKIITVISRSHLV
ncbi:MAG TPA: hypothetical protein VHB79_30615 [Polyangiaceae bacterium]|nr:hypothetical protein [Polyangiaceae bacterium]